ncbi:hypothetical protein BDV23DRAFT_61401 [Aspergillus alliaceus]|uniref:DUF3752 domain-containing protein n=1 Tax=Petromyces alliaceus TaxID=209559 RepID=A0A5N7BQ10_PETAA|nr:hypothetical protein BDV23DRAFT_61401 [Aspergillus alliaceus]
MEHKEKRMLEQSTLYPKNAVDDSDTSAKRRKVVGPTLPLSNTIDEHTPNSEGEDESSDDDEIGPSLPPSGPVVPEGADTKIRGYSLEGMSTEQGHTVKERSHRDEWMLQPPESSGWTSRVDPTKLRSRKFQTGRSASNPASGKIDSSWTETPDEKMKRLQDEVMGVGTVGPSNDQVARSSKLSQTMRDSIKRYKDARREGDITEGVSQHLKERKKSDEDDPSSRPFDREKDVASSQISSSQRREMINRASDFGSRFSKGSFL